MKFNEVIEKGFLKKFILLVLAVFIAGSIISSGYFLIQTHILLNTHYGAVLSIITEYKNTLVANSFTINLLFFILIIIGVAILGVIYSHKISGPLYRIKLYAKKIGEGELNTPVGLREGDMIHPFADSVNQFSNSYNTRLKDLASETVKLKKAAAELASITEEGKERDDALQKVIEADNEIRKLLEGVKT